MTKETRNGAMGLLGCCLSHDFLPRGRCGKDFPFLLQGYIACIMEARKSHVGACLWAKIPEA